MSQAQPSPMSLPSSPPSLPTSSAAEQTEQPDDDTITIRYAETDEDVCAIHQFLLVVARPEMRAPVDPMASLLEIIRVAKEQVAIMAIKGGRLVGTLGLMQVSWWYAPSHHYMVDRWHFVLPQFQNGDVNRLLIAEADSIAEAAGLKFYDQGKIRERRGRLFVTPRVTIDDSNIEQRRT
jgi:hypothetical protein